MARALPSAKDLGVVQVQPSLGVANYRGATGEEGGAARGLVAAGGSFVAVSEHLQRAQDEFDLTQAEAVIDVIKAKTMVSLEIANQQLRGWLHKEMAQFKTRLVEALALIEAHIDFPEEEIGPISLSEMEREIGAMVQKLDEWVASYPGVRKMKGQ